MFAWINAKRSEHPLEDPKDAAASLVELSKRDTLAALQELSELLDAVKTVKRLDIGRAYEIVDAIDRTGRLHYRRAAREFIFTRAQLTKFQANRIWTVVGEYLVQLAEAYQFCLAEYEAGANGAIALRSQLVRMLGRGTRLRAAALKWDYLRYTTQFGQWAEVYRLHEFAQVRDRADEKVLLYRGGQLSSVEREFVQALMLATAAPHGLLPEQIEVAERIASYFGEHFVLSTSARHKKPYFFDPASSAPPTREQPGVRPPSTARRFGPGTAEGELRQLARHAEDQGLALSDLSLEGISQDIVRATLQHLIRYWCEVPQERRHARRRLASRIIVVHGFDEVAAKVSSSLAAYPFVSDQEAWLVENSADGGIGALVSTPHGAWVGVGELIAYRLGESSPWNAGIVRHISQEDDDTRYVGVELLGPGQGIVSLYRPGRRRDAEQGGVRCVWLSGDTDQSNEIRLLMPRGLYSVHSSLEMRDDNRRCLLMPLRLLETGADYEVGFYNALQRAVDASKPSS